MNFSIVVPCYNEEKSISAILERFADAIGNKSLKVILVDNGSSDSTRATIERLLPQFPFAQLVVVPENKGYGYGILQGLKVAYGDYVGWTHADMQTDPADVVKAINIIEKSEFTDLFVKGHRKNRGLFDNFFTMGMSIFESLYLAEKLTDINAQPNMFPRKFFEQWENPPWDFSLDLYSLYLARKKALKVIRFKVAFPPRIHGKSHWNTGFAAKIKFIKRTLDFSIRLKKGGIS